MRKLSNVLWLVLLVACECDASYKSHTPPDATDAQLITDGHVCQD